MKSMEILLIFDLILTIAIVILAVQYGRYRYDCGRLAGFKDCSQMTMDMLGSLDDELAKKICKKVQDNFKIEDITFAPTENATEKVSQESHAE